VISNEYFTFVITDSEPTPTIGTDVYVDNVVFEMKPSHSLDDQYVTLDNGVIEVNGTLNNGLINELAMLVANISVKLDLKTINRDTPVNAKLVSVIINLFKTISFKKIYFNSNILVDIEYTDLHEEQKMWLGYCGVKNICKHPHRGLSRLTEMMLFGERLFFEKLLTNNINVLKPALQKFFSEPHAKDNVNVNITDKYITYINSHLSNTEGVFYKNHLSDFTLICEYINTDDVKYTVSHFVENSQIFVVTDMTLFDNVDVLYPEYLMRAFFTKMASKYYGDNVTEKQFGFYSKRFYKLSEELFGKSEDYYKTMVNEQNGYFVTKNVVGNEVDSKSK
jgi:hypothetical protein